MRACFQNGIHLGFFFFFGSQTFLKNKQEAQHNSTPRLDYDGLPTAKGREGSLFA